MAAHVDDDERESETKRDAIKRRGRGRLKGKEGDKDGDKLMGLGSPPEPLVGAGRE